MPSLAFDQNIGCNLLTHTRAIHAHCHNVAMLNERSHRKRVGQINDNEYRWGEWRGARKKTQKNVREPYAHIHRYACVYICIARTPTPL